MVIKPQSRNNTRSPVWETACGPHPKCSYEVGRGKIERSSGEKDRKFQDIGPRQRSRLSGGHLQQEPIAAGKFNMEVKQIHISG